MIRLKSVTKMFQLDESTTITPVRDVDLEIERGEFLMVVGRSGSGKTTLLNLCAGFIKPTAGQVLIDGKDLQTLDEKELSDLRSNKIGFVFQTASMLPSLSVIQNVAIPSMFGGEGSSEDRLERAGEVLTLVGLGSRAEALPRQLSGGETRRVAIARALMNRPEILIADEPTSDLDVQTELMIVAALQKIHQTGVTVLMVTHNLDLIPYATRALTMQDGRLLALDEEVQARALPLALEPGPEPALTATHRQKILPKWLLWLRKPAVVAYVMLGLTLALLLVCVGLLIGKSGTNAPAVATSGSGPGPVLSGAGMTGAGGTYDPSEYNLYGNSGLYASVTGGAWPYRIDPAPGDDFKDPVELDNSSSTGGVFEGKLEAKLAQITLGNTTANVMTYNGDYPGPLIRVRRGDRLDLELINSLPATSEKNALGYEKNHTNLRVYGLHVSPTQPADDATVDVAPGESYKYEYDLSKQPGGTLGFIHPGVHGLTAEQQWGGLLAPVIVEDDTPALAAYETHVMVIKDVAVSGNAPQAHLFMSDFMYGKEGSIVTVNGQLNPVLSVKRGQVQRWRIINASNARFYRLYLENHLLYLVGTDGGLLDKPYTISTLVLAPGERADILVKATTTQGSSRLISLPYSRQNPSGAGTALTGLSMSDQSRSSRPPVYYGAGMYRQGTGVTGVYGSGLYGLGSGSGSLSGGMGGDGSGSASGSGIYSPGTYGGQNPATYAYWPAVTNLLGMTTTEILTALGQGRSLAEIGETKGARLDVLTAAVLNQIQTSLAELVQTGDLLQIQADQQLAFAQPVVGVALTTQGSWLLNNGINGAYNPFMYDPLGYYGGTAPSTSTGTGGGMGASGTSMGNYDMSAAVQVTLLTMTAEGNTVNDPLPSSIAPEAALPSLDLNTLPKRTVVFNMDMGNGYLNGMDFDMGPFTIQSKTGTHEIWEIVNPTTMDQPFHMQTNSFRVLSVVGGDIDYARIYTGTPSLKDTVIVPRMGTVALLVQVDDFEGVARFGSNIAEHADIGMVGRWEIGSIAPGE